MRSLKLFCSKVHLAKITYYVAIIASITISVLVIPTFVTQFLLTLHH